jgi:ribosomal protein L6P/L9E
MSRIGNKLISLPAGVTLTVEENNLVVVKGPKGELSYQFNANMGIEVNGTEVKVISKGGTYWYVYVPSLGMKGYTDSRYLYN